MKKLYVSNLNYKATDDDLQDYFGECGEIASAVVIKDRATGKSRGFGFVEYADEANAKSAIEKFNGSSFMERNINVAFAREKA